MIVAFKPFGGINTASSRLRVTLPIKYLNRIKAGIVCEVFRYENLENYSIVIFQKAYTKEDIEIAALLRKKKIKVFFDLCDNHFYNPDNAKELAERAGRLTEMVALADEIIVSNKGLGELTNRPYTVIDDMMENSIHMWIARKIWRPIVRLLRGNRVKLVWFGSSGSEVPRFGMIDLQKIISELNELDAEIKIQLSVISNSQSKFDKYTSGAMFPTKYFKWHQVTFPYIMQLHDITIIPIDVNPFTICKTNNRPLLSLLLGLPVVADKIPSYESLSNYILFGGWKKNIAAYATNVQLKESHVKGGYHFAMKNYNNHVVSKQWLTLLEKYKN